MLWHALLVIGSILLVWYVIVESLVMYVFYKQTVALKIRDPRLSFPEMRPGNTYECGCIPPTFSKDSGGFRFGNFCALHHYKLGNQPWYLTEVSLVVPYFWLLAVVLLPVGLYFIGKATIKKRIRDAAEKKSKQILYEQELSKPFDPNSPVPMLAYGTEQEKSENGPSRT